MDATDARYADLGTKLATDMLELVTNQAQDLNSMLETELDAAELPRGPLNDQGTAYFAMMTAFADTFQQALAGEMEVVRAIEAGEYFS